MIDLEEIERALSEATPGPWSKFEREGGVVYANLGCENQTMVARADCRNATLIARAPTWLARLVAEVRRLREQVADAQAPGSCCQLRMAAIERADASERERDMQTLNVAYYKAEVERLRSELTAVRSQLEVTERSRARLVSKLDRGFR